MEMPKVGEQHEKLAKLAGRWSGDETIFPSMWDPKGGPAAGEWEWRAGLDGFFAIADYTERRDGAVSYRGHGVFGWDGSAGAYT